MGFYVFLVQITFLEVIMSCRFVDKLAQNKVVAGVVGLGYVGLPLVREFVRAGYKTIGFDIDPKKVNKLNSKQSYIKHIPDDMVASLIDSGMFVPTTDYDRLKEVDAISICVPTPLDNNKNPDLSYVEQTCIQIAKRLREGQLVILESTTYPGTTDELMQPILEKTGLKAGQDFHLTFSPEREDPGNPSFQTKGIPKVVGGITPGCLEAINQYYGRVFDSVVPVSSTRVAEMTKLLENIFRCVNIALVNELKILADKMGFDIWEVIKASSTKPFGFMPFYPGPGLGGHCIPIDPFYLSWKAREYDFSTKFIDLAGEINTSMPYYVVEKLVRSLGDIGKPVKGSKILVLGVAYKKDVDDIRESPALKVISLLKERGLAVKYHDPYIPAFISEHKGDTGLRSEQLDDNLLKWADVSLILTDHTDIDYQTVVNKSALVIDTRNATAKVKHNRDKIIKA